MTSPTSGAEAVSSNIASPFAVDPATIEMPTLAFDEKPEDVLNYEKYFYFVREGTDFATAYSDVRECDGYARGLSYRTDGSITMQYGLAGALGNALADAIFGSAERRKQRRTNVRTCMFYKGYKRFGIRKELWTAFNFDEGNSSPAETVRQGFLQRQAKVASGPMPQAKELGR